MNVYYFLGPIIIEHFFHFTCIKNYGVGAGASLNMNHNINDNVKPSKKCLAFQSHCHSQSQGVITLLYC